MPKREDYLKKNDYYMNLAKLVAMRSKDPHTQVGAVIVSAQDRILSTGYNGMPNGCSDDEFPWEREAASEYDTKYAYALHAEMNAILSFRGDNNAFSGATIYTTLFPCNECTKALIQVGIKTVYYEDDKYKDELNNKEARRMLDAVGIKYIQHIPTPISLAPKCMIKEDNAPVTVLNLTNANGCSINGVRYCANCGSSIDINHSPKINFCPYCGLRIKK